MLKKLSAKATATKAWAFTQDEINRLFEYRLTSPLFYSDKEKKRFFDALGGSWHRASSKAIPETGTLYLLDTKYTLPTPLDEASARMFLMGKSPLFQEQFTYLGWLIREPNAGKRKELLFAFDALPVEMRNWSTYGVATRIIHLSRLLDRIARNNDNLWTPEDKQRVLQILARDASFVYRFLELDVKGNHLVRNQAALMIACSVFSDSPTMASSVKRWWHYLKKNYLATLQSQLLDDGMHFERAPMYHQWVLGDVFNSIVALNDLQENTDANHAINTNAIELQDLFQIAETMVLAAEKIQTSTGEMPLIGDSVRNKMMLVPSLRDHLTMLKELTSFDESELERSDTESLPKRFSHFSDYGLTIFNRDQPRSSLSVRWQEVGPRSLPAHAHSDLASVTLSVGEIPVIVDGGTGDYQTSLVRDYFRSSAAHNSLWIPDTDQAELWSSFRVAEYPNDVVSSFEADEGFGLASVTYENHSRRYGHKRDVYDVAGDFWVIQDWLMHLKPEDRPCYSLLHLHPEAKATYDAQMNCVQVTLTHVSDLVPETDKKNGVVIIPYGMKRIEVTGESPWRNNLNLYARGYGDIGRGQLIAGTPKDYATHRDCFGWVVIPYFETSPVVSKSGEAIEVQLNDTLGKPVKRYLFTVGSSGLDIAEQDVM